VSQNPSQSGSGDASSGGGGDQTVHHISRRKKQGVAPARMQLNLTSMIDVIFQLLIYFVVTANFMLDEGVLVAKMPQGTGKSDEQQIEPPPEKRPV